MIQISSPILIPEITHESRYETSVQEPVAGEQEKPPGFFAKLLKELKENPEANKETESPDKKSEVLSSLAQGSLVGSSNLEAGIHTEGVEGEADTWENVFSLLDETGSGYEPENISIDNAFAFIVNDLIKEPSKDSFPESGKDSSVPAAAQTTVLQAVTQALEQASFEKNLTQTTTRESSASQDASTGSNLAAKQSESNLELSRLNIKDRNAEALPKEVIAEIRQNRANGSPQGLASENSNPSFNKEEGKEDTRLRFHESDPLRFSDVRLSEARLSAAGKSRFTVRDLRTEQVFGKEGFKEANAGEKTNPLFQESLRAASSEIEIPVDLRLGKGLDAPKGTTGNISFEDALAKEIRENLSTDIVRDASFIIKNGGEGTIRLSLRPASLGDVKIHLQMSENKITGQIILQSSEAFRAFERELPVLERAFRDSGYGETSLEMSLAGDDGNYRERDLEAERLSFNPVFFGSRYESEDIQGQGGISAAYSEKRAVNLLV
ncbi:MAG: flagellar hook-length control protein FliK [Treponema sp.]|nr:flagellar hook-length control protein FliK [Treponema sp.]